MTLVDTLSCEAEPIRYPGAIQPHGALLVLNSSGIIEAASESCEVVLGCSAKSLLDIPFSQIVGSSVEFPILSTSHKTSQPRQQVLLNGRKVSFRPFLNINDQLLLDIESCCQQKTSNELLYQYRQIIHVLRQINDFEGIIQKSAKLIRQITGLDRVMIYRFDELWNGKVIAEACIESIEPYLGFNFPASDIPQQARELFQFCQVRQIPDVLYTPSTLLSLNDNQNIDLGLSHLRSVSPVHIEYLINMKVRANLAGALMVEGRLWGLVACHHTTEPKYFSPEERDILGWLFEDLATLLQETLIRELREREYNLSLRRQRLIDTVRNVDIKTLIQQDCHTDLLEVVAADGFALLIGDSVQITGATPAMSRILEIQQRHLRQDHPQVFASYTLDTDLNLIKTNDDIAGVLIFSIRKHPSITMMWFRKERYYSIRWGGNPQNAHIVDDSGRISPRKSFAQFIQNISGQSLPWLPEEINSAKELGALIDIELLRQEQRQLHKLLDSLVLSEEKFSKVFNFSPIGIAISRIADDTFIDVNDAFLQIYGYTREEVIGYTSTELNLWENPSDRKVVMDKLRQQGIVKNEEISFRRKSGETGTLLISFHTAYFSDEKCILGVVTDITERKWLESKLNEGWQLKQFASYLQTEIERERTKIARDIHDDLGSRLTSIKLAISQYSSQPFSHENLSPVLMEIDGAIQSVKIIATDLRPSILDTLGLRDAIDWLIDDFASRTTIQCIKALPDEIPIEDSLRASAVFRILQESLTNITKHTNATEVFLHLELDQGNLTMTIEDNGCGITEKDINRFNAFGLLGMRERADYLDGTLTITNVAEGGTQISLTIPLNTLPIL